MTSDKHAQTLMTALTRILRPLVKLLLRYGISYAAFAEVSKKIYFEIAKTDFAIAGKKQTASRISTLTGLSRKEVARLDALPDTDETLDSSGINRAARVISGWVRDDEFQNGKQQPDDLPFEGEPKSFSALVKRYSGDITARTIADELTRIGAISWNPQGHLHLNTRAYIANTSEVEKLTILGTDVSDLVSTIDHNLTHAEQPYLQRKVSYNYIPIEAVPEINSKLTKIAQTGLENMDKILSDYAVAKNKAKKNVEYVRVGIGVFYFEGQQK